MAHTSSIDDHTSSIDESSRSSRHPPEIAATALGLVSLAAYTPIGLAGLLWKAWSDRGAHRFAFGFRGFDFGGPTRAQVPAGNTAFEDYKRETLERLERERRKLQDEEREFAEFLRELRRAKDKEEFDRFMASRHGRAA